MTIRTVADLRRALEELPDYYELGVEVLVGGDVRTDTVGLERVHVANGGSAGVYVELVPAASSYEVLEHIDNGLAAYAAIEEATIEDYPNDVEPEGFIRYTRDPEHPAGLILDHVAAWRVSVYDGLEPRPARA